MWVYHLTYDHLIVIIVVKSMTCQPPSDKRGISQWRNGACCKSRLCLSRIIWVHWDNDMLERMNVKDLDHLVVIRPLKKDASPSQMPGLVRELQRIGTTALDISKGSYFVNCILRNDESVQRISVQVIISLCHSLSDGPGALRVAQSFLQHLGDVLLDGDDKRTTCYSTSHDIDPQPLTALQALILGNDYGAGRSAKPLFEGQDEFASVLKNTPMSMLNEATVLPPEAMQNLPTDEGFGGSACIDCIHFTFSAHETTALRNACRRHGTTVQGAITAASIKTRAKLLGLKPPVEAAVQVPVNTRSLANVDSDECLCGSAGVWHLAKLCKDDEDALFTLAKQSSDSIQDAIKGGQPQEWLRRLFHSPTTLASYSIMVSSIGIAPMKASYECVDVEQLYFFGGAMRTDEPSRAQSTMLHAVTFRDKLTCMLNFTSPGVSKEFIDDTAKLLKATLLAMAFSATMRRS